MDIGERIELEEPERRALRTGEATVPQQWPLGYLLTLEELMRERILDKQSLLDEFRINKKRWRLAPKPFSACELT